MTSSLAGGTGFNNGSRQSKISMKPKGYDQFSQYTPEQHEISQQRQQLTGPGSYYNKLANGDQDIFDEIEAPAMRQFQGLQGQIASRFSQGGGQGSLGSRKSSGFQNTINQAGSDFAQDLASKRHSLRDQAIKGLHGMYGDLINEEPYGLVKKQNKPKWWESLIGGALPLAGAAGAYAGGQAGSTASQSLF
jgi:hypothetical protein